MNPSPPMSEYLRVTVYPQYYSSYTLQKPWNEPGHLAEPEPEALLDHTYCLSKKQIYEIQKQSLIIPLQYADDIGYVFISKDNRAMQYQQSMLPQLLMKRNLTCNESKTETYSITRDGDNTYKNCRYLGLGSLLDTTEDFKRRKILAMNSMRTYDPVWKTSNVSIFTKSEFSIP